MNDELINKEKIIRTRKEQLKRGDISIAKNSNGSKVLYTEINIGDRLRDIRKDNKFTQAELGELIGTSRATINSWEMGIALPSTQFLIRLARLYRVSTDYLLGIETSELVDITHLKASDKEIIYGLLKRLE